jgi:hypothetical protein
MNDMNSTRTLGSDTACDIVLEDDSVAGVHAHIELAQDGLVSVVDQASEHGVYLHRNDRWIRAKRVILCSGDRICFGEAEVPIGQLTSVFGPQSNARLERKPVDLGHGRKPAGFTGRHADADARLQKPRRNPVTGKIEEDRAGISIGTHQTKVDQQE